ncbi:hypothetical protein ABZV78_11670 [Micromonospora sp. NPDC004540]|uniref:hypothetical protein n=1 Tax=Micromonospora sp. NPDC004540 TaxID=3154457 RepID=UPI0033A66D86
MPAGHQETVGGGTFRQAAAEATRGRRRQCLPRFVAVLLGISAAVALAGPSPARPSVVPAPALDGPTCPISPALSGLPDANPAPAGTARLPSFSAGRYAIELAGPGPQVPARDCLDPGATPTEAGEAGKPLPLIPAAPGQPLVAESLSTVTGSTVTMTGLRIQGIVDLPTAGGTLRTLKFSMDRAVTDDFLLRAPGPGGRTMRFAADRLTLTGEVALYATRFVGRLLGVTITLTPDLPVPAGIPVTSPITISDPVIDLAFMNSHSLTARPALKMTFG